MLTAQKQTLSVRVRSHIHVYNFFFFFFLTFHDFVNAACSPSTNSTGATVKNIYICIYIQYSIWRTLRIVSRDASVK